MQTPNKTLQEVISLIDDGWNVCSHISERAVLIRQALTHWNTNLAERYAREIDRIQDAMGHGPKLIPGRRVWALDHATWAEIVIHGYAVSRYVQAHRCDDDTRDAAERNASRIHRLDALQASRLVEVTETQQVAA